VKTSNAIPLLATVFSVFAIWALNWAAQGRIKLVQDENDKRSLAKKLRCTSLVLFIIGSALMILSGLLRLPLYDFSFGLAIYVAGIGYFLEGKILAGQKMIHSAEDPGISMAEWEFHQTVIQLRNKQDLKGFGHQQIMYCGLFSAIAFVALVIFIVVTALGYR